MRSGTGDFWVLSQVADMRNRKLLVLNFLNDDPLFPMDLLPQNFVSHMFRESKHELRHADTASKRDGFVYGRSSLHYCDFSKKLYGKRKYVRNHELFKQASCLDLREFGEAWVLNMFVARADLVSVGTREEFAREYARHIQAFLASALQAQSFTDILIPYSEETDFYVSEFSWEYVLRPVRAFLSDYEDKRSFVRLAGADPDVPYPLKHIHFFNVDGFNDGRSIAS